ncbi:hypothetical protein QPK87_09545 [Kamptonema cortianum]|nr:hypothetical protein [Kamptonema cortianum]
MKILKKEDSLFQARLTADEYDVLGNLLRLYPVIPHGYHILSQGDSENEDQKLLDEMMDESRSENKKALEEFLQSDEFFSSGKKMESR